MYRYITLVWPHHNKERTAAANYIALQLKANPEWEVAFSGSGILVLHTGAATGRWQAYPLTCPAENKDSGGVVLGKLFTHDYINNYQVGDCAPDNPVLNMSTSDKIISSNGKYLIDHYWGKYTAFLYNPLQQTHYVLADPTGGCPCFYTDYCGVGIYFADINDCETIEGLNFSINWDHIAKRMLAYLIQTDDTGLKEVTKLLPGECRAISESKALKSFYWDPVALARQSFSRDVATAAHEMRRITMGCINAWASCYNNIILHLSGGLDSSIILGCLMQANPQPEITCLNYFDPASDERAVARLMANFASAKLLEREPTVQQTTAERLAALPKSAKLQDYHYALQFAAQEAKLAQELGADAFFAGHSGDELFYSTRDFFSAVDYAHHRGMFRPGFLHAAMEAALVSRMSLWSVLRIVCINRYKRKIDPFVMHDRFRASDVISARVRDNYKLSDTFHPLLRNTRVLPPGKCNHVISLLSPHLEPGVVMPEDKIEETIPLYSQPLLELCLTLPTYLLSAGGKSRGLARMAFSTDIPPEIAARESKGSGTGFHKQVFQESIELSKTLLLDGLLVREGMIDHANLARSLEGSLANFQFNLPTIKSLLSLESWLRKWEKQQFENSTNFEKFKKTNLGS